MSGHSKWSTIKRQKGAADARRSALFTKLGHAIAMAARGGADPTTNFKLRLAIDRARTVNLPNENIERAIQRGSGSGDDTKLEEVIYEAYGPGGVAIIISALTDNRNRTTSDVRSLLNKHGATLAAAGSVSWLFTPKGQVRIARAALPTMTETLELALIDAGVEDIQTSPEGTTLRCPAPALESVRAALEREGLTPDDAGLELIPTNMVTPSTEGRRVIDQLEEELHDLGEIQNVATNASEAD